MLHRSAQVTVALFLALCPVLLSGQAAPREFYVVCTSQANLPTVYFSGMLQGPATALVQFRTAFTKFLMQSYSYQGGVDCAPSATAAISQNSLNTRVTALRRINKSVVETGWAESAAAASAAAAAAANPPVAAPPAPAPAPASASATASTSVAAAGQGQSAGSGAGGGNTGSSSQVASILGGIFGTNTGSTSAGGASGAAAAGSASGTKAQANPAGGANQSPAYGGITGTLTSLFGNKSTNSSNAGGKGQPPASGTAAANPGGQPAPAAASANAPNGLPAGALGTAQFGTTKLVVYGCGRQDMQVACVMDLTNQNTKDTLVQSADVWKDAFIVDDRGDRHVRASGFFLNIDGDQRQQLDISYGKTARFILMFGGVPTKVAKVALRSATGGLDVEEIGLISPGAATTATAPAGQQH